MIAREDLPRLRMPLAMALLLLLLGIACLLTAELQLSGAKHAREAAKSSRMQAQQRLERVAEEEREIRKNLAHYARIAERGIAREENRLDLIDIIARIKSDRKLFEIKYSIEPQKRLEYPGMSPSGQFDFVASRVRLDMQLLHEEDLLHFFNDLDRAARSHMSVRECSITRIERSGASSPPNLPTLRSECAVDLILLRPMAS